MMSRPTAILFSLFWLDFITT